MYKNMLQYFLKKYQELHGRDYAYIKAKLGLVYMQFKRLNIAEKEFQSFIDWLYQRKKLSSINFLMVQLNDFHASKEYQHIKELEAIILHHNIMVIKNQIVSVCGKCRGNGYIWADEDEKGVSMASYCSCMVKFLKIRDKMRKENVCI